MRLLYLVRGDIRFQFKYGFYFLYLVFGLLYVTFAFILSQNWRQTAVTIMIFTDPTALGLYFMGAILLFEKSERVLDSLAVSPVSVHEYVLAKLLSIGFISTLTALLIALGSGLSFPPFFFICGIFLGSCFFSSVGLIIAARCISLNDFILDTIPVQLIVNLPALAYLLGWNPVWLLVHPGVCVIELLQGGQHRWPALLILCFAVILIYRLTIRIVRKMFISLGGMRL